MAKNKITGKQIGNDDGWRVLPDCVYQSSTSVLFAPGVISGVLSKGMKIKFTNASTVKYFVVTNIATDGGSNNIVFLDGMNGATVANSAITLPYYSTQESPYLFPQKEVLLFNGSVATSVTISEVYTNFKELRIIYLWVDAYGTTVVDTANTTHNFTVVRQGLIGGAYKIQVGAAKITLSGTTVAGTSAGNTYTNSLNSSTVTQFLDNVGDVQIVRVVGIR